MESPAAARRMSLLLLVLLVSLQLCQSADLQRAYGQRSSAPSEEIVLLPKKRPFCNAFTGCGRKRSELTLHDLVRPRQLPQLADEDVNGVQDSGEPSLEDLRQVLTEARMWEAMQDAGAEMYRKKLGYPLAYNAQ